MARRFSGRAVTMASSSVRLAGRTSRARGADEADLIRQGLAVISSSETAVLRIAFRSAYARAFTVGVVGSRPAHQCRTWLGVTAGNGNNPNVGSRYR